MYISRDIIGYVKSFKIKSECTTSSACTCTRGYHRFWLIRVCAYGNNSADFLCLLACMRLLASTKLAHPMTVSRSTLSALINQNLWYAKHMFLCTCPFSPLFFYTHRTPLQTASLTSSRSWCPLLSAQSVPTSSPVLLCG